MSCDSTCTFDLLLFSTCRMKPTRFTLRLCWMLLFPSEREILSESAYSSVASPLGPLSHAESGPGTHCPRRKGGLGTRLTHVSSALTNVYKV